MAVISSVTQNNTVTSPPAGLNIRSNAQSGASSAANTQVKVHNAVSQQTQQTQQTQETNKSITEQDVQKAIDSATLELANSSESIGFAYEQKLSQLYVQIRDNNSGEVIREIPSKDFIKHRLAMQEIIGLILDRKA